MGIFDRLLGKPTIDDFASALIAAIRESGCADEFLYDRAEGVIHQSRDGKQVSQIHLGNQFRIYRSVPRSDRASCLQQFARIALTIRRELPEEYDLARPDLRPRLWTRSTTEFPRLRALAGGSNDREAALVAVPLGRHLQVCLGYDWPESVQSVPPDYLETWGVSVYQALEDARANLAEATEGFGAVGTSLYQFLEGDSYDAARILLTDWIGTMPVQGQHVAMVPNRDTLLITGSEDVEGLEMMVELAEAGLGESYPLIGMPLILEDGAWTDWLPPADHPLGKRFHDLHLRWIGGVYTEQKQLLDALHQATGEDVFVASFSAFEKDGAVESYGVWGEGVRTLLPVTDRVALISQDGQTTTAMSDWTRVLEVAGHLLEETEDYPPRFRTLGFPDAAMIAVIGSEKL